MTYDEWLDAQEVDIRSRLSSGQLSWLRAAFEAGRAIERNACAALADHWGHHFAGLTLAEKAHVSWMIRDAIRDRANHNVLTDNE